MRFKRWLVREGRDIFGFDKSRSKAVAPSEPQDKPIIPINSDFVVEYIMSHDIRGLKPNLQFSNQIQWGEGTGAIRMKLSPLGSFKIFIRKLQPDLQGCPTWVCKKIVAYEEIVRSNSVFDEKIADEMVGMIDEVGSQDINAPNPEYDGLEGLTRRLSRLVSRSDVMPEIFIYKGMFRAKNPNNWILAFECRGHGVEAPEGHRLEQFNIDMSYNPKTGMIRSFGQNIESPTKGHIWEVQPSEWDEHFSSGQPEKEIMDAVASALKGF